MAEKRCENCGAEIEAFASRLHEELGACSDDCGIERVAEKDQNYSRAARRLQSVREELGRLLKIDPKQHEHGYPGAFGAAECIGRIALIEAGGN